MQARANEGLNQTREPGAEREGVEGGVERTATAGEVQTWSPRTQGKGQEQAVKGAGKRGVPF